MVSTPYSHITYIPTGEGWLYLASTLDLGSRRLAGWAMADHMRSELVEMALEEAATLRGGITGAIFHADRGSQYMSGDFGRCCERFGVTRSAGRVATCFDNSVAESFWSSLKSSRPPSLPPPRPRPRHLDPRHPSAPQSPARPPTVGAQIRSSAASSRIAA